MSVYLVKGKGWRYDFTLKGARYTNAWFQTKTKALQAEARRKEEIRNPAPRVEGPIDMTFLELVEKRLDHVKAYNSASHYRDTVSLARNWVKEWDGLMCSEITNDMVQNFMLKRSKVSGYTANKDLRYLRTLINFGIQKKWIMNDPTEGIVFFPVEKGLKYIPSKEDVLRVIMAAETSVQEYLWTLKETMGRMGEINRLTWSDVDFEKRYVVLYTRKKKGGHLTPRKIPMTNKLYEVLSRLFEKRDKEKPWIFWHRYWDKEKGELVDGPFQVRSKIMKTLCKKAGVKYFRFHALRHFGASVLDNSNVNIGAIQRILGHENRKTTEIYLHSVGEAERDAMRIFEEASQDSHTDSHTDKKNGLTIAS